MKFADRFARFFFSGIGGLMGGATRIEVYRTLELLTRNNVPPHKSFASLYGLFSQDGKKPKESTAMIIRHWQIAIANGKSQAQAMAPWIPPNELSLIRAGEDSGELADTLEDTMVSIRARQKIMGAFVSAIAGPLLLGLVTIILLYVISSQFVPSFEKVLPINQWPESALILKSISDIVLHHGVLALALLITSIFLVLYSLPNMAKSRLRVKLDNFGPWAIYRILNGSSFLLSLAVLMRAGTPVEDALITLSRGSTPWMRFRIGAILKRIKAGHSLGVAMVQAKTNFPDSKAVRFLRIISEQDGLEQRMVPFANEWLDQSIDLIIKKSAFMKITFIFLLFAILLLTAISFGEIFASISS